MRCPVCRAENVEGPNCRRCRADLGSLFAMEKQRQRALNAAYQSLADGQFRRASALAEGAQALHDDMEARRLAAMSALLTCDFASACRIYNSLDK